MARARKRPLVRLTLSLLREGIQDPEQALDDKRRLRSATASSSSLSSAVLYYHAPRAQPVGWLKFVQPAFAELPALRAQHASAVLFFKCGKRLFAATFGYGHALLHGTAVESNFGIRTALNLCDPDTLRSIDFRTIEERTRIGRIQLSQAGTVGAFRVDTDTDLLRGVEATSNDPSICERVGGKWSSLTLQSRIEIDELPALGRKLLSIYAKRKLPADFRWIDNVQRVTAEDVVDTLDRELGRRLDSRALTNIRLAVPEISGLTTDTEARLFTSSGILCDAGIAAYLEERPRSVADTVKASKQSHKVVLVTLNGEEKHRISVYQCIVAEIELGGVLYLLTDGEWFHLDRDFVEDVNRAMRAIKRLRIALPAWKAGTPEGKWNEATARSMGATLLDKRLLAMSGRYSAIEPADLLTNERVFMHVKRRDKSSAGLSHLFAQGRVATEMFTREKSFRDKLAGELGKRHSLFAEIRSGAVNPSQWTIAYVLLGADPNSPAESLPFFSKVNLRKHVQGLESMQYAVRLAGVATA